MATRYSQLNIDIHTLKQKTGVTDTQLDQRIEQEQLWSLAGLLGSYKKFVRSSGFDLNNADVEDLKDCASKHGNQQAMYDALMKWGKFIRDFTYRSLLEILISLREGALADQVCRIFIQTQASEPNKEDAVSLSSAPAPATGHTIGSSSKPVSAVLQQLMDKYQLTTAQVDHEIQRTDLPILAAYFDDVELYVDAMELTNSEKIDILKAESNHLAMIVCLNIWKSKKLSQATFSVLLEMLIKLKKEAIADDICQYIKEISTKSIFGLRGMSVAQGQEHTTEQAVLSPTTEVEALLASNGLMYTDANRECKDDIFNISLKLEKWEIVATWLGLTPAQIEAIQYDYKSIEMMIYFAINKWKSKNLLNGIATYRVLLQALLALSCNDQAKQVCSLLKESLLQESLLQESLLQESRLQESLLKQRQQRRIFDDALRDGAVTVKITNALIQGEAGVGKTCIKRILCNQGRPSSRDSTPLADISVHVRDVTDIKVHSHNNKWKEVNEKKMQDIVGAMISGIVREIQAKDSTETVIEDPIIEDPWPAELESLEQQLTLPVDDPNEISATLLPPTEFESLEQQLTLPVDDPNEISATLLPPTEFESFDKQLTPPVDDPNEPSATLLMAELESLIDNLRDKVVDSRHPSSQAAQEILGSNWIYFIDSGGQPHFHNLLPHFVHGISIALFTLKLSEELDSHSIVEYYENGKLISTPYPSPLTTIDSLKCLVRSMQSHTINGEKPTLVIVGTFRDKIKKSSETFKEKNERLKKKLLPEFTDQLVFCEDELIFALNGKNPSAHDQRMAEMIKSVVEDSPSKVIKMPVWWYVLEISLKEMSSRLNRKVLSKQECMEVAKQINIEEDALVEALKFFHEQHIFHYYVDILPNVVFTSPQVLLDKLTELVKEAYDKRIVTTGLKKGKWQKFQNKGIITLEFVEYFSGHYVEGLFSPPDLLKLFMSHLILTPFSPTNSEIDFTSRTAQYFMPSLLDMLTQDKLIEYRFLSVLASPLLIRFPNGWPRAGVFCCLQVYLIRQLGWKLLLIRGKPKLIAQNCVLLSPPGSSCRVILIDSFSYIEIHVDGCKDVCSAMCPKIRNQIDTGIRASCQRLRYSEEQLQLAFFCPCTLSSSPHSEEVPQFHAAVLLKDGNLRCTFDESITSRVQSEEMIWLQNTAPATGHTVGSSAQPVGTRLMDTCQLSTTAQASEPKKGDAVSSSPPPALATGHTVGSSSKPVSTALQQLMDKYQLTTFQIDREILQKEVPYLAAYFDNVELYVDAMELSPSEQSDVLLKRLDSNHLAMIKCLKIWKSKKLSQATFRALLEMLVKLKKGEIADYVCQYIKEIPTTSVEEGETQSLRGIYARGHHHTTEQAVLSPTTGTEVVRLSRKRLVRSGSRCGDEATEVDALLSSNGLTCTDGNKECKDDHILNISLKLEQWELVATRLGLTAAEREAIKGNNQTIEMMRYKALKKWKSKNLLNGTATDRVLLQALLALSCNDQTKQVCSLLKESLECQHKIDN